MCNRIRLITPLPPSIPSTFPTLLANVGGFYSRHPERPIAQCHCFCCCAHQSSTFVDSKRSRNRESTPSPRTICSPDPPHHSTREIASLPPNKMLSVSRGDRPRHPQFGPCTVIGTSPNLSESVGPREYTPVKRRRDKSRVQSNHCLGQAMTRMWWIPCCWAR